MSRAYIYATKALALYRESNIMAVHISNIGLSEPCLAENRPCDSWTLKR